MTSAKCVCVYLLIATVRASGELAQGHMTSDFKPLDWKTLRKASQDEIDPIERNSEVSAHPDSQSSFYNMNFSYAFVSAKFVDSLGTGQTQNICLCPGFVSLFTSFLDHLNMSWGFK